MSKNISEVLSNKRLRNILILVVAGILVVATIGVGTTLAANDTTPKNTVTISEQEAKDIALKKTGGGKIIDFDMDYEDGIKVYQVEIINGDYEYDVEINATTGVITEFSKEVMDKDDKNKQNGSSGNTGSNGSTENTGNTGSGSSSGNTGSSGSNGSTNSGSSSNSGLIGKDKAKSIALAKVGGGKVVCCKLDYDDGRAEYDIEIIKGDYEYEMEIDAKTGKILDFDKERIDDDDDDDDDWDDDHDDD